MTNRIELEYIDLHSAAGEKKSESALGNVGNHRLKNVFCLIGDTSGEPLIPKFSNFQKSKNSLIPKARVKIGLIPKARGTTPPTPGGGIHLMSMIWIFGN